MVAAAAAGPRLADALDVTGRLLADGDQAVDAELGNEPAHFPVKFTGFSPQLTHVTEDGHGAPPGADAGEKFQRRAHRERVGVVAVVKKQRLAGQLDELAPEAAEVDVRDRAGDVLERQPQQMVGADGRHGVQKMMVGREIKPELDLTAATGDDRVQPAAPGVLVEDRMDVRQLVETESYPAQVESLEMRRQQRFPEGNDQPAA